MMTGSRLLAWLCRCFVAIRPVQPPISIRQRPSGRRCNREGESMKRGSFCERSVLRILESMQHFASGACGRHHDGCSPFWHIRKPLTQRFLQGCNEVTCLPRRKRPPNGPFLAAPPQCAIQSCTESRLGRNPRRRSSPLEQPMILFFMAHSYLLVTINPLGFAATRARDS